MTREPASASDPARRGRGLVAAMTDLFLQPTGSPTQYEVIADAQIVGRVRCPALSGTIASPGYGRSISPLVTAMMR